MKLNNMFWTVYLGFRISNKQEYSNKKDQLQTDENFFIFYSKKKIQDKNHFAYPNRDVCVRVAVPSLRLRQTLINSNGRIRRKKRS